MEFNSFKNTWDEGGKWDIRIISELETSLPRFVILGRMGQSTFLHLNNNTTIDCKFAVRDSRIANLCYTLFIEVALER
ncbi:TPA: hypothetical protein JBB10_12275 [Legionella pneumophila subsp. pneumophila]|nr:hypothetical protein [Legionella pneumophila subsp. pneumophila]